MAEAQKLSVRSRVVLGKQVSRLRRDGKLPGVIFGGRADSTPVETDTHVFELGYRRWGNTTLLSLEGLSSEGVPALINGVSRDPRTGKLLHVDFARVSLTEKTHADVPLHFSGESPAVKTLGGVLVHALDHVRVEAFPQDMPRRLEVDLSKIEQLEDTFHVRDLVYDATTVRILNDLDDLVARAVLVKAEAEPTPVAAEAAEGEVAAEGEAAAEGAAPAKGAAAAPAEAAKGAKPEKAEKKG
ncbi:MAG: 50S ribosomal protein L25 [Chloroflexi bacterium]|nr:50S ribosomal protein L25 [Chloroflexota bacterium]